MMAAARWHSSQFLQEKRRVVGQEDTDDVPGRGQRARRHRNAGMCLLEAPRSPVGRWELRRRVGLGWRCGQNANVAEEQLDDKGPWRAPGDFE